MRIRIIPLVLMLALSASLKATNLLTLDSVADQVVSTHMIEKQIPGISVAIVHKGQLVFAKGYGKANVEFDLPATPDTVYPISSVSRMFAGLLAVRLADAGRLDLDAPILGFFEGVPGDKRTITVRHLLQHTHGLEDYYQSDNYLAETGKSSGESSTEELIHWSFGRPLQFLPGADWSYGVIGYVVLAAILERVGEMPYPALAARHVFSPLNMSADFGGSETVIASRNPLLYELVDDELSGHIVDFPQRVYAAADLNMSVLEMARLFASLSGEDFIGEASKQQLWHNQVLGNGKLSNYGLGWFSYETSKGRWVVGHEGGGASWVIYYPDLDLAVIALSNMSGARADSLPYEIARLALANGLFPE